MWRALVFVGLCLGAGCKPPCQEFLEVYHTLCEERTPLSLCEELERNYLRAGKGTLKERATRGELPDSACRLHTKQLKEAQRRWADLQNSLREVRNFVPARGAAP
jgi:hypothetical protein